jgi:hypothetical protein
MQTTFNLATDPYTVYIPQGRMGNLVNALGWGIEEATTVKEDVLRPLLQAHMAALYPAGQLYSEDKGYAAIAAKAPCIRSKWERQAGSVASLASLQTQNYVDRVSTGKLEAYAEVVAAARERVLGDPDVKAKLQRLFKIRLFNAVGV